MIMLRAVDMLDYRVDKKRGRVPGGGFCWHPWEDGFLPYKGKGHSVIMSMIPEHGKLMFIVSWDNTCLMQYLPNRECHWLMFHCYVTCGSVLKCEIWWFPLVLHGGPRSVGRSANSAPLFGTFSRLQWSARMMFYIARSYGAGFSWYSAGPETLEGTVVRVLEGYLGWWNVK